MPFWCLFLATDCSGLESVSLIGSAWPSWTRRPAAAVLRQHVEQRVRLPQSGSICAMSRLTLVTMSAADEGFEGAMTALAAEIESLPTATLYLTLSKPHEGLNAGDTAASQSAARQSCSCDLCSDLGA